jgi:hypothetical protein
VHRSLRAAGLVAAVVLLVSRADEPSRGVVATDTCLSGRTSAAVADGDGTGGEPTAERALARLEARVTRDLGPSVHVVRRDVTAGTDRVELLLTGSDGGAVGGALTERTAGGWQLTGWWSCSP